MTVNARRLKLSHLEMNEFQEEEMGQSSRVTPKEESQWKTFVAFAVVAEPHLAREAGVHPS